MSRTFFTGWALWGKLTFVLACAMVITIFLGCLKLLYSRRKLRYYTAIANQPLSTTAKTIVEIPMTYDIEAHSLTRIPFGIRAIESGIEVEGVWISPSAMPSLQGSRDSSPFASWRQSSLLNSKERLPSQSVLADKHARGLGDSEASTTSSLPITLERDFGAGRSTRAGSERRMFYFPKPLLEPSPMRNGSIDFSQMDQTVLARSGPSFRNSESTLTSMTAYESSSTTRRNDHRSYDSDDLKNDEKGDLGLLDHHRLHTLASTGQLTPRIRAKPQSDKLEFDETPTATEHTRKAASYFNLPPPVQDVRIQTSASTRSLMPIDVIPASPYRPQSQAAVLVSSDEPLDQPPSERPVSQSSSTISRPFSFTASLKAGSLRPSIQRATSAPAADIPQPSVARVINSGFEILKSGSTPFAMFTGPSHTERQQLLNEYTKSGGTRKLQKKRRGVSKFTEAFGSEIERVWTK